MSAEEVVKLFDSRWFGHGIETQSSPTPPEQNPDLEIDEEPKKPDLSRLPTLHVRSLSDQSSLFFSSDQDSVSPNSVLMVTSPSPRLQTIPSGKVMKEGPRIEDRVVAVSEKKGCKRSRKKKLSKSLSELEFDELKGFMDLGFVFSEEDKDSSLVSIIPGLQRFGSREEEHKVHGHEHNHVAVSRPYLSEAWEVMEQKKKEKKPLMINLRMADLSNEMDVKDHLKFWAHSVASAVR